jgi:hypothetical protein
MLLNSLTIPVFLAERENPYKRQRYAVEKLANYIPLVTTVVASVFTILLLWQYAHRKKIHQLVWTTAMALYAIAAFMEFLANPEIIGPSILLIKVYYVSAGPLVGLLGAGVLFLLVKRKFANLYLGLVVILALALLAGVMFASFDQSSIDTSFQKGLAQGFHDASTSFPPTARIPFITLSATGGTVLVVGALYSFVRDRRRIYNIPLLLGGLLPTVGGSLLGILNNADVFFEFELAGTVFLFIGFVMSMRYIGKKPVKTAAAPEKSDTEGSNTR